eukprot:10108498-Alexandrium_andersonii.AAC.1
MARVNVVRSGQAGQGVMGGHGGHGAMGRLVKGDQRLTHITKRTTALQAVCSSFERCPAFSS